MKITPLDIRQKTFEKAFRGLDKDEVMAFLNSLSQEWERMLDETKELRYKLETSQKEVEKLREVENSLFKTLKTAEDTGANMVEQANKAADLHLKEAQMKADAMLNEAKTKARNMMEEADHKAKESIGEMEDQLKNLAHVYKNLESYREDLLADIKSLAQDALEKVERAKVHQKHFDLEEHLIIAKREAKQVLKNRVVEEKPTQPKDVEKSPEPPTEPKPSEEASPKEAPPVSRAKEEPTKEESRKEKETSSSGAPAERSFFDDLD